MGNQNYKGDMLEEVKKFMKEKNVFPCSLKSDSNGKIIKYSECFNHISFKKIEYRKEEKSEFKTIETENEYKNSEIGTLDIKTFLDISYFHCDSAFKKKKEKENNYSKKITLIVGKHVLYSFSIRAEHICLTSFWLKRFEDIAYSHSTDMEKAKELDEIFKVIGFFIPLEIKVGGLYMYNTDDMNSLYRNDSLINFSLKKDEKDKKDESKILNGNSGYDKKNDESKNRKFFLKNSKITGGNIYANDFDEWKNSLTFNNSEIIEFDNIMNIKNILDNKIRNILRGPLEIIEKKYEIRKEYYKTIQYLKNLNECSNLKGTESFCRGICEERNIPQIYYKKYDARGDGSFFSSITIPVCHSFNDIIVGWHINSCWVDGTNGTWTLEEDPLLKKQINCNFESKFCRGERFEVFIYLMKFPE